MILLKLQSHLVRRKLKLEDTSPSFTDNINNFPSKQLDFKKSFILKSFTEHSVTCFSKIWLKTIAGTFL